MSKFPGCSAESLRISGCDSGCAWKCVKRFGSFFGRGSAELNSFRTHFFHDTVGWAATPLSCPPARLSVCLSAHLQDTWATLYGTPFPLRITTFWWRRKKPHNKVRPRWHHAGPQIIVRCLLSVATRLEKSTEMHPESLAANYHLHD